MENQNPCFIGWMEWAVYRTDPTRAPARASTRDMNMASCGCQPQVSPLPPTGVQAVLSTGSGVAKYLACASGPQSESVYHLYQELLRPSLFLETPAQTPTPAPRQGPAPPSFHDATLSYHLYSLNELFWSYGRLGSAKPSWVPA